MRTITQKELVAAQRQVEREKVRFSQTLPSNGVSNTIRFLNPQDKRHYDLSIVIREFFEEMTEAEFSNIKSRIDRKRKLKQQQIPIFASGVILQKLFA